MPNYDKKYKFVCHERQKVYEMYKNDPVLGWINIPDYDNIPLCDVDYVELIHTMEIGKDGLYGRLIKWE